MSDAIPAAPHIPVLLDEVIAALAPAPGDHLVEQDRNVRGGRDRLAHSEIPFSAM